MTKAFLECSRTKIGGMELVCDVIIGVFKDDRRPIPQTALVVKVRDNRAISQTSIVTLLYYLCLCKSTANKNWTCLSYFWTSGILFTKNAPIWTTSNKQSTEKRPKKNEITAWNVKHIYLNSKVRSAESVCGRLQKHYLWRHRLLLLTIFPSTLRIWRPKKGIFNL